MASPRVLWVFGAVLVGVGVGVGSVAPGSFKAASVQVVPRYQVYRGGTAADTVALSVQDLAAAVRDAGSKGAQVVVLPEGGTGVYFN